MTENATTNLLDEISQEVANLSDEELAQAAQAIQARKTKEKARMTPERAQKMKDREKRRRLLNSQILKAAKEKGLVKAEAPAAPTEGAQA